jgi:hypothetical protein
MLRQGRPLLGETSCHHFVIGVVTGNPMEFHSQFLSLQGVAIASGPVLGSVHFAAVPGPVGDRFQIYTDRCSGHYAKEKCARQLYHRVKC